MSLKLQQVKSLLDIGEIFQNRNLQDSVNTFQEIPLDENESDEILYANIWKETL